MKKAMKILPIISLILLIFTACSNTETDEDLIKIKVGFHTNYGGSGALFTGLDKGFFEEQGLQVEIVPFTAGPAAISALNAGTIDFAYVGQGAHSLIIDGHAKIIVSQNISDAEAIIASKSAGIEQISDLTGKRVAVMLGTSSEELLKVALNANDIDINDVEIVNYDMAGAVAALVNGDVDAICVWEQYRYEALQKLGSDGISLASTSDFSDDYIALSSWVTDEKHIQNNANTVQKFVTAMVKSQNYWEQNTEEVCRIISNELDISLANLLQGQDLGNIFSIAELKDYIQTGKLEELYTIQQDYFLANNKTLSPTPVDDYLITKYMENAVNFLSS